MGHRPVGFLVSGVAVLLGVSAFALAQPSFQDELANLRSPNVGTRVKAAKALGESQRLEAVQPLIDAMRDPELKVRRAVIDALRNMNRAETTEGLLIGLKDEDKSIRETSIGAILDVHVEPDKRRPVQRLLGFFSDEPKPADIYPYMKPNLEVIVALEERLQDDEASLRRQAAFALGVLRDQHAVGPLSSSLNDPALEVRTEALDALAALGGDQAGQAVIGALTDSSSKIRGRAIDALGTMKYRPAARELLQIFEAEQGKILADKALQSLALMGAPEARGVFFQMMTNPGAGRRRWAVEGLGRLDDASLVPGLTKDFLREPDSGVQLAYCFSLARLGRPEFIDRLALSLPSLELRDQARAYIVDLGSALLPEIVVYLSDPVVEVRRSIVSILAEIGDPAAVPYLEPLLSDPDREVSDRANRAITRLRNAKSEPAPKPS